jgi:hypothetical protein
MLKFLIFMSVGFLFMVLPGTAVGQSPIVTWDQLLETADSVLITSHEVTYGPQPIDPETGEADETPLVVVNNQLNEKIIKEKAWLTRHQIIELRKIVRQAPKKRTEVNFCLEPHHAILAFHQGKISYLDLCFSCNNFISCPNIDVNTKNLLRWNTLEAFFKKQGFTYKL